MPMAEFVMGQLFVESYKLPIRSLHHSLTERRIQPDIFHHHRAAMNRPLPQHMPQFAPMKTDHQIRGNTSAQNLTTVAAQPAWHIHRNHSTFHFRHFLAQQWLCQE